MADQVIIDVDAHRAARREKLGPAPIVRLDGRDFTLPQELPADAVYALGAVARGDLGRLDDGVRGIFGKDAEAIFALADAWEDQQFILMSAVEAYGFKLPESTPSAAS